MTPLRLGLAGFGRLARDYYLPAIRTLTQAQLVAIADPSLQSRAVARARCAGVAVYETLASMLETERLDGLLVASPPSTHLAAWQAARVADVAAFVEKPLLLADQLSLIGGCDDAARVMVDFNRRFWPPYERARAAIAAGMLGTPIELDFQLHLDVLAWCTVTEHRLAPTEGGIVHDLGCHAIDVASWVLGEKPDEITAVTSTERWPNDRLRLTLQCPSGSKARADLAYGERTREWVTAHGPEGCLRLDEPNMWLHVRGANDRRGRVGARMLDVAIMSYRAIRRSQSAGRASIRGALAAFIRTAQTGGRFEPGIAEGLWNARCVAAAVRSAADGGSPVRP